MEADLTAPASGIVGNRLPIYAPQDLQDYSAEPAADTELLGSC